jgi:hypothetical protein
MLAADNWCVRVDERVYGPYTSQQLRKFAAEGRLAGWSQIAPAGSRTWREAKDEPTFSNLFGGAQRAGRAFGKRDDVEPAPSARSGGRRHQTATPAAKAPAAATGPANFILVFDVVNAAASRVESAIMTLGPAFRLTENVWAVTSDSTATGVRNAIAPYLLPRESIFVIDTTRGRSSWQNYAPELHAKIAAAWTAARA